MDASNLKEHLEYMRTLTDSHKHEPNAWINGKVLCYAVYEAGGYRIGFQHYGKHQWDHDDGPKGILCHGKR